ncbi:MULTISPECIES: DUF2957 domain-containing protein [Paraburkholderia]|uniref:DUF2957 domain-containing protein n=1 Tax=Paraburkholderia tropica TaxID=92647 RepID=A0A1A5X4M3_9BURK|nr:MULTISPECIES: DUF2957 domain-containing protein [Paraburkholderia]MBB2978636.1 hypothetical protein [Paraburkholderia tropica]MBB2998829.1 hypothetical protein [Paraburkholderia tropica]MDE1139316.1 DUF2957 domain-containing protein [Paraburkholderia tropica]OBR48018.1 hypothetical protein A6456_24740 [Paraburkholderia tropica]PXX19764.1 hypothetical protein C7400_102189 [Paraburkholderia tropica]
MTLKHSVKHLAKLSALGAPLLLTLSACGGGGSGSPPLVETALCPTSLDYNTVYTGGGGDGELVKLQLDTTKKTWQITYVESPIPATTGTVTPTRKGQVVSGTITQETALPTAKLNQCAFQLNGASLDASRPARVFIGFGVAGGTIPGAEIQFAGSGGIGVVPDTKFPYYPFIGFSTLETNIANVAGTYNQLGYHQVPSQNFLPAAVDAKITINADGTWQECDNSGVNAGTCQQPGTNFVQSSDGSGAFETDNFQGQVKPTLVTGKNAAKGFMIVGKLRNQLVPVLVRTGVAYPQVGVDPQSGATGPVADDESGISVLAPQTAVAQGSQDGEYIGVDSQFDYRTLALSGTQGTLLDPFNASQAALATALDLNFTESVPGLVTTTHVNASTGTTPTGKMIFTGGVFGFLDLTNASSPYFTAGAFVQ